MTGKTRKPKTVAVILDEFQDMPTNEELRKAHQIKRSQTTPDCIEVECVIQHFFVMGKCYTINLKPIFAHGVLHTVKDAIQHLSDMLWCRTCRAPFQVRSSMLDSTCPKCGATE